MDSGGDSVRWKRLLRRLGIGFIWLLLIVASIWATAALYFDLSLPRLPLLTPLVYLLAIGTLIFFARRRLRRMAVCLVGFLIVLTCWLSLKPSNDRDWQADDSQTPWAEIDGDRVTIHN